ncbi:MAG TPA: MFS transporter, partial [Candidatus Dormibacteraeota bacterium]
MRRSTTAASSTICSTRTRQSRKGSRRWRRSRAFSKPDRAEGLSTHHRERRAVSAAFLAFGVVSGSWVPRLPAFKDHLHLTDGQIGFALLMYAVGAIAGAGLARLVLSRGSRSWVRIFTIVLCLALVPVGLAFNFAAFVVAFLILGAVAGFIDMLENAQAADVERAARRPMLNGFHGFWSLGTVLGSIAAGAAAY